MTERHRVAVRPTGFGLTLAAIVAVVLVVDVGAGDPQVGGLAWTALAAVVVIGAVWPWWVVGASRVVIAPTASDVVVGEPVGLAAVVTPVGGPIEVMVDLGELAERRWWSIAGRGPVLLAPTAARRGVIRRVDIVVRSSAPLGIVRVTRRRCVEVPCVWIAPAPVDTRWRAEASDRRSTDGASRQPSHSGDVVRSVRPYVVGDPAHLVHWPTSARTGDLVVRELEPPADLLVAVVVHLDGVDVARDDTVAGCAAGLVEAISDAGGSIVLCTCGPMGPATVQVASLVQAGRVLAEAVPGPPGAPPAIAVAEHVGRWSQ